MPKAVKAFEFKMGQRLNVPGLKDVQGVITAPASPEDLRAPVPADADGRHHLAFMRWFDERGQAQTGWFPVPEVLAANQTPAQAVAGVEISGPNVEEMSALVRAAAKRVFARRGKRWHAVTSVSQARTPKAQSRARKR
jgi:hypothetical protein